MAKVINPLNSTEARGKVGGLVYNTWRGIRTVKTNTAPSGQGVGKRAAAFDLIVQAGKRWATLTDTQRQAWRDWAKQHVEPHWTGTDKRLPGYSWYVRIQVNRQWLSQGYQDTPPLSRCMVSFNGLHLELSAPDFVARWDPSDSPLPGVCYTTAFVAGPHSPGYHATLHDAVRDAISDYSTGEYDYFTEELGTFTVFLRAHNADGMPGTWVSATGTLE